MIFDTDVDAGRRAAEYARQSQGTWLPPGDMSTAEGRTTMLRHVERGPRVTVKGDKATVYITGPMDSYFGFDAARMATALDAADGLREIDLAIASPGGFVETAFQTYADIRARADAGVTVSSRAIGMVASAATIPFMAGDERTSPIGGSFMAHAPYVVAIAAFNRHRVRELDGYLEHVEAAMRQIYEHRGITADQVFNWFDGRDHFMLPTEAARQGLLTGDVDTGGSQDAFELLARG